MICPNCEHRNPESNRFCGMCGSKLNPDEAQELSGQETAPADKSGRRPFIVSTTAMADVTAQMLNSQVVLPSPTLSSSHSGYASPLKPQSEPVYQEQTLRQPESSPVPVNDVPVEAAEEEESRVHEIDLDSPEEAEAERWLEQTAAEHESRMPPPVSSAPTSGSILGLSAPVSESVHERHEAEPVRDRNSFLFIDDGKDSHASEVSGPSFLGLGSDVSYEEEPSGRGRLFLLVAMLAIVVVLGGLEWRASQNGESTNPMDVLHLKLPKKKGQGQVQVLPSGSDSASNSASAPTSTDNSNGNTAANNGASSSSTPGKPDLIAEPNQSAAAKPTTDNTSPDSSATQTQNSTPQNASNAAPSSPPPEPTKPADTTAKAPAKATELAETTAPPAATRKPAPAPPAKNAKPSASKAAAADTEAAPEADASLSAGGAELQKGIAAGSTEMGRMWLWKATAKGNGEAPVRLAEMYAQGRGVPRDCEQAMLLLNAAARKMNVRARSKLGSMYAAGECVPQDRVKAYKWMSAALEANPGSEWIEKNRESLMSQMTPAERQRASR